MRWLVSIALGAVAVLAFLIWRVHGPERNELWVEVGKGCIEVVVVVVLGGVVKRLADAHQERRRLAEARQRFREDKYRRIVDATSLLRRALFSLIASGQETPSEALDAVLQADAALRAVKHEIYSSKVSNGPFRHPRPIVNELESMFSYTTSIAKVYEAPAALPRPRADSRLPFRACVPDRDSLLEVGERVKRVTSWTEYQATEASVLGRIIVESLDSATATDDLTQPGVADGPSSPATEGDS